jgi:hypothetical protein
MPNILQRPMFRRGGSAAKGSGITSGLTERKQYADGPDINDILAGGDAFGIKAMPTPKSEAEMLTDIRPGIYDLELAKQARQQPTTMPSQQRELEAQMGIIRGLGERMAPTGSEVLEDTAAAIAATAPEDPTKLQTFGSFLSKAGTGALGLKRQREEGRKKFERDATLQVLKNMTDSEKDQLFRYAKEYAKRTGISEDKAYKMFLDRYLKGTPSKGLTTDRLVQDYQKILMTDTYGYPSNEALNIARTQAAAFQKQAPNAAPGPVGANFSDPDTYKTLRPGTYIDPASGDIYRIDEQGKEATKVWPTK